MVQRAIAGPIAAQWTAQFPKRLENGYLAIEPELLRRLPIERPAPDTLRERANPRESTGVASAATAAFRRAACRAPDTIPARGIVLRRNRVYHLIH